ncbi:3'-5' exoribonuclease 1-like [Anneissia japonica]|uniref:3'-5' exoribonuclease 1-like n=1 Tax=Anneissia japonica TaxID=1529436 RepID=UPI0014259973|nr:3'-5' exoribonuclease 1-like [Anneissia japonica]XP_033107556.1 3'-5' exoribonuclease 1-like [Anneissia japonica]
MDSKRKTKYYLVCDLEATCVFPRQQDWEPEIIEIGAILLDRQLERISAFQRFVCPEVNGILTPFCRELTKITQRDVDRAYSFPDVYDDLLEWMRDNGLKLKPERQNFTFVTDGIFDCNQYIRNQCKLSKLKFPKWAKSFSNIKKHFNYVLPHMKRTDRRSNSITDMMEKLKIPMDGQLHRAIDDAKQVVKIMKGLRELRPNFEFTDNETIKPYWSMRFFD